MKRRLLVLLYLFCLMAEVYFVTFGKDDFGVSKTPVLWLGAGLSNALIGGWLAIHYRPKKTADNIFPFHYVGKIAFAIGVIAIAFLLHKEFQKVPDTSSLSDIIPGKKEYVRRFLNQETVYQPIQFDSYALQPTFLPARWMPFIIADLGHFDYRWIPFGGLVLGLIVWLWRRPATWSGPVQSILIGLLPMLGLWFFIDNDPYQILLAVELLMAGYYLMLARWMLSKWTGLAALVILLCLLSRHAIILWLPFLFLVQLDQYGIRYTAKVLGLLIAGVISIYVLPFCLHDYGQHFISASQYYLDASFAQWKVQPWQQPNELPYVLGRGIGFSVWFYKFAPGDLASKFQWNVRVGLVLSIATTLLSAGIYWRYFRQRSVGEIWIMALVSLKVFMLVFTGFIFCPFSYLFEIPFFLSFPILFLFLLKSE